MRMNLSIDEELLERARKVTGIQGRSDLIREALEALIARESARRLAALGGSQPKLRASSRRRV
ncbi:MAG: type II toxin-antitoxin system VapB family antitoxin [Phycisphaerales bacterium]|nr:type II toxin-antitoxin system VapB family antitoxin [Phycisphaerales bacterium]